MLEPVEPAHRRRRDGRGPPPSRQALLVLVGIENRYWACSTPLAHAPGIDLIGRRSLARKHDPAPAN